MTSAPGDDYELIVQEIVTQLARRAGVDTTRLEHEVAVVGRATTNWIDVLWDFTDAEGQPHRVVFEARDYKSPIKQGALHAFRSVVDDIQDAARPVEGVMVTTTGYQRGAKRVAETYGVLVMELSEPTESDLAKRLESIVVTINMVIPVVTNHKAEVTEIFDEEILANRDRWSHLTVGGGSDGSPARPINEVLVDGELGTMDVPGALHEVRRDFDPPVALNVDGQRVAMLRSLTATVGASTAPPVTVKAGGLRSVALMLRDALTGARLWFGEHGQVWSTDS